MVFFNFYSGSWHQLFSTPFPRRILPSPGAQMRPRNAPGLSSEKWWGDNFVVESDGVDAIIVVDDVVAVRNTFTNAYYLHARYGVRDVFEPEDLTELKNIPKVTKCVDELAKLVSCYNPCFTWSFCHYSQTSLLRIQDEIPNEQMFIFWFPSGRLTK